MKKTMRILFLALVLVLALLMLAACGHEHSFAETWSHDGSHHWHAPTCEHEKAEDMPDAADLGIHDMTTVPVVVAPTCGKAGTSTTECRVCGFKKVETLPPTGQHSYGNDVVYTEEDANGVIHSQKKCTACGKKGPFLHMFDGKWSTDAENHWHAPLCECEGADAPSNIYVAAHTFGEEVTVAPTCVKEGTTTKACKTCNYVVTLETVAALGHTETVTGYIADGITVSAKVTCSTCRTTRNVKVEGAKVVLDTASAQEALDTAEEGAFIYFMKADYDTLFLRTADGARETYVGTDGEIHYRAFKNITLVAHNDATFRGFVTEASTATTAAAISLENVTIRNFRFTGSGSALLLNGYCKVNGLTLEGCTMKPAAALEAGDKPYLLETVADAATLSSTNGEWSFTSSRKDITVKDCTVENTFGLVSLLGTENVTVTGNSLKNLTGAAILLAADTAPYTGTVTVTDNSVFGLGDRFLLAEKLADVSLTLTGNSVASYKGTATDIVKAEEDSTLRELTNENNTFPKDKTVVLPTPAPAE